MNKKTHHILIVEDSRTQALKLKFLLEQEGYRVSEAPDGRTGLERLRKQLPDLVISDVMMPHMDGYTMCAAIKKDPFLRHVPVILLTTLSDPGDLLLGLESKADFYLTKPYDQTYLLRRVAQILENPVAVEDPDESGPVELVYAGQRHRVDSSRRQMFNLLMSTYENAVQRNVELTRAQEELQRLNQQLAAKVQECSASEERFRAVVMTIPDIVYRIDVNGKFVFINDAVSRLGYQPGEIIGKHFSDIVVPAEVDQISRRKVLRKFRGRQTGDREAPKLFDERRTGPRKTSGLEVRLLSKFKKNILEGLVEPLGEEVVTVEVNSSGMYEVGPGRHEKQFIGTVGVIRDISGRKQMESSLRESEERLQTILDCTEAGIMVIEPERHCIVDVNPAAARMIGRPAEEIVGTCCHQSICPIGKETCPANDLADGAHSSERHLRTAENGDIPVLKTVAPITLKGKRHLLETFVDISRLKEAEKKLEEARNDLEIKVEERTADLKRSQSQLLEIEKIGALGTLTAGIAHELNNPMMGMLNFIEYSLKHADDKNRIVPVLEDVKHETLRCIDIVKNLLTFSRMENENDEKESRVDIHTVLDRVFRLLAYRIEKENVNLEHDFDPGVQPVLLKPSNFQQVLLNLVGNALDALKESAHADKDLAVSTLQQDGWVKISVSDSGDGIPDDRLSRIFDPFFTTKPPGKGTGLGLSVSRSIIESHGGRIVCRKRPGSGTVFEVLMPVDSRPPKRSSDDERSAK